MNLRLFWKRISTRWMKLDTRVEASIQSHFHLLMAVANFSLALWALLTGRVLYAIGMAIIGALGYFGGFVIAIAISVLLLGWNLLMKGPDVFTTIVLEALGYLNIAWLGFHHKRVKQQQKLQLQHHGKDIQVLSWAMVNEVRTSLAAVRFLLFPLNSEHESDELKQATNELSRLEKMFQDMEKKQRANHDAS